jgi:osmotically-inducible protein OsmY
MKTRLLLAALCLSGFGLSACAPAILIGTGAVAVGAVAEDRTTMANLEDSRMELSIQNALLNHSGTLFRDVAVEVTEGRVLLIGTVPTREDRVVATQIAWETEGVTAVEDSLEIGENQGTMAYLTDARISNTLRLEMLTDTSIKSVNYNIETVNRVVHITGLARSRTELDRVIRRAQEVEGVQRVVSHALTLDDPRRAVAATVPG